jgi:hypothetical protein
MTGRMDFLPSDNSIYPLKRALPAIQKLFAVVTQSYFHVINEINAGKIDPICVSIVKTAMEKFSIYSCLS